MYRTPSKCGPSLTTILSFGLSYHVQYLGSVCVSVLQSIVLFDSDQQK